MIETIAAYDFNPHTNMSRKFKLRLAQDAYSSRENSHYDPMMNRAIVKNSFDELIVFITNHVAVNAFSAGNNPEFTLLRNKK
jgi:hypothetical protein